MTNIEQNAMKIAELLGWNPDSKDNNVYNIIIENRGYNEWLRQPEYAVVKTFSSYDGLMPIVFECHNSTDYGIVIMSLNVTIYQLHSRHNISESYKIDGTEQSFIEAIQNACIKYLELKND
jgi:hypothetical protein